MGGGVERLEHPGDSQTTLPDPQDVRWSMSIAPRNILSSSASVHKDFLRSLKGAHKRPREWMRWICEVLPPYLLPVCKGAIFGRKNEINVVTQVATIAWIACEGLPKVIDLGRRAKA